MKLIGNFSIAERGENKNYVIFEWLLRLRSKLSFQILVFFTKVGRQKFWKISGCDNLQKYVRSLDQSIFFGQIFDKFFDQIFNDRLRDCCSVIFKSYSVTNPLPDLSRQFIKYYLSNWSFHIDFFCREIELQNTVKVLVGTWIPNFKIKETSELWTFRSLYLYCHLRKVASTALPTRLTTNTQGILNIFLYFK